VLAEDDDSGEDFNSQISDFILPKDGVYTIIPSALDSTSGAYTISLFLAEPITRRLEIGDTVLGKIEENIEWTFEGQAGQVVTIEMQEDGSGIDTFLTLLGPDGQVLVEDDDGGDGRNSRISGFILTEDGIYKIIPKALDGSFGAYRISIIDE
jgi:hypothetical protein